VLCLVVLSLPPCNNQFTVEINNNNNIATVPSKIMNAHALVIGTTNYAGRWICLQVSLSSATVILTKNVYDWISSRQSRSLSIS
jgi:NAD(P)H-dependent FMN reductase